MVETRFCKKNKLELQLQHMQTEVVVKSVSGHGGTEVFLVENQEFDPRMLTIESDFVIQPLIGNKQYMYWGKKF